MSERDDLERLRRDMAENRRQLDRLIAACGPNIVQAVIAAANGKARDET